VFSKRLPPYCRSLQLFEKCPHRAKPSRGEGVIHQFLFFSPFFPCSQPPVSLKPISTVAHGIVCSVACCSLLCCSLLVVQAGTYPKELHQKAYEAGIYGAMWPQAYGGTPPEGCDAFHDLIVVDEIARCGSGGLLWSVFFTFGIALPPVLNNGSEWLKNEVARDVITGRLRTLARTC
jgi:hypothetical protein